MSEAIESLLGENRLFQPPVSEGANIASMEAYQALVSRFDSDHEAHGESLPIKV